MLFRRESSNGKRNTSFLLPRVRSSFYTGQLPLDFSWKIPQATIKIGTSTGCRLSYSDELWFLSHRERHQGDTHKYARGLMVVVFLLSISVLCISLASLLSLREITFALVFCTPVTMKVLQELSFSSLFLVFSYCPLQFEIKPYSLNFFMFLPSSFTAYLGSY